MEMRGLRSLVNLAELGTIARCAEASNISAAAVHKQLKVLEDELDLRLYEHVGRRLQLTPAAEILLPHARSLLAEHDAARDALGEWKRARRGVVRLGCGATLSSHVMPPLLAEFQRRNPAIEVHVQTGHINELAAGLANGRLDVVLQVASQVTHDPPFVVEQTWKYEMVFVSLQRLSRRPLKLARLANWPLILYRKGGIFASQIENYLTSGGLQPRVAMRMDNAEGMMAMVRLGVGLAVVPIWLADRELRSRNLTRVRLREPPLVGRLELVRRRAAFPASSVAAFVEMARGWRWANVRVLSD